jgi:glyoxylase-like metal-dependent hydrolase (beta-lactamase superfamily II)
MITRLKLSSSNAYLIRGERNFLVDSGSPSDWHLLEQLLLKEGFSFKDLAAVIHTHGHSDHAGCSARLQERFGTPTVIHHADTVLVSAGRNGQLTPKGFLGHVAKPFLDRPFPPFRPTLELTDLSELSSLGFPGYAIHTPGHTEGSISLVVGGSVLVGDVARGGLVGGAAYHLFVEDLTAIRQSIARLLRTRAGLFYPGHFSPFTSAQLSRLLPLHDRTVA